MQRSGLHVHPNNLFYQLWTRDSFADIKKKVIKAFSFHQCTANATLLLDFFGMCLSYCAQFQNFEKYRYVILLGKKCV